MAFNLDGLSYTSETTGYFPHAIGVDRGGNECMMVVSHDPSSSGCNPFYWNSSPYNRFGYEVSSKEEAEEQAKYARGSWSVKSVDMSTLKIGVVHFKVAKKAVNYGDAS